MGKIRDSGRVVRKIKGYLMPVSIMVIVHILLMYLLVS